MAMNPFRKGRSKQKWEEWKTERRAFQMPDAKRGWSGLRRRVQLGREPVAGFPP